MRNRIVLFALGSAALIGAAAAAADAVVDQSRLQFSVAEITVTRGGVVTFTNSDRVAHNLLVTGGAAMVNSGLQQPGQPFEIPFSEAGRFDVTCGIHPRMKLTVTVE